MTDREIFKKNLNYYLSTSGKMQKDLAEYVGAKTTTVSGWTRGVSFPRADSMEKIAMFFGIPTSRLVSDSDSSSSSVYIPRTEESRTLAIGLDQLPKEMRDQALSVVQAMFVKYADLFKKEDANDT